MRTCRTLASNASQNKTECKRRRHRQVSLYGSFTRLQHKSSKHSGRKNKQTNTTNTYQQRDTCKLCYKSERCLREGDSKPGRNARLQPAKSRACSLSIDRWLLCSFEIRKPVSMLQSVSCFFGSKVKPNPLKTKCK